MPLLVVLALPSAFVSSFLGLLFLLNQLVMLVLVSLGLVPLIALVRFLVLLLVRRCRGFLLTCRCRFRYWSPFCLFVRCCWGRRNQMLQSLLRRVILAAGNNSLLTIPCCLQLSTAIGKYSDFYQAVLIVRLVEDTDCLLTPGLW